MYQRGYWSYEISYREGEPVTGAHDMVMELSFAVYNDEKNWAAFETARAELLSRIQSLSASVKHAQQELENSLAGLADPVAAEEKTPARGYDDALSQARELRIILGSKRFHYTSTKTIRSWVVVPNQAFVDPATNTKIVWVPVAHAVSKQSERLNYRRMDTRWFRCQNPQSYILNESASSFSNFQNDRATASRWMADCLFQDDFKLRYLSVTNFRDQLGTLRLLHPYYFHPTDAVKLERKFQFANGEQQPPPPTKRSKSWSQLYSEIIQHTWSKRVINAHFKVEKGVWTLLLNDVEVAAWVDEPGRSWGNRAIPAVTLPRCNVFIKGLEV